MGRRYGTGAWLAAVVVATVVVQAGPAEPARAQEPAGGITKLEVTRTEPAFGGKTFGEVGAYTKIVGRAHGEVDPRDALNRGITDLANAPRNGRGNVEYTTDVYLLTPANPARGNGLLFQDIANRGNKNLLRTLNRDADGSADPADAGDGLAMRRGYTLLWSGWQGDLVPDGKRMTIDVPVAHHPDGSAVTGTVRSEITVPAPTKNSVPIETSAFEGAGSHRSYPAVSLDAHAATLTQRVHEKDPRRTVPSSRWRFATCDAAHPWPGTPSRTDVCVRGGLDDRHLYELTYHARDPLVLGVGFAATRDIVSYLRYSGAAANPLAGRIRATAVFGASQSGRFIRSFIDQGFNQDLAGRRVWDGADPHIASGRIPLNVRFGQPGRAYGQHEDHLYPQGEAPTTWSRTRGLGGTTAGELDRCGRSHTCPRIMQTFTSSEFWNGRMFLNLTDPRGTRDVRLPPNVRLYFLEGTQHGPSAAPSPSICKELSNPDPDFERLRNLLVALADWVGHGVAPPASRYPTLAAGLLATTARTDLGWPAIPGVEYTGISNEPTLLDFGPHFDAREESGTITVQPPRQRPIPGVRTLVPRVDADGNERGGIASTALLAPVATYTGWNIRGAGYAEGDLCGLTGSYLPFPETAADRAASGDPRRSVRERYGDHAGYVAAVRKAATTLRVQRLLLPADARWLVAQAEDSDVLTG